MFIDDVAMYLGAVDTTAPSAPTSPSATVGNSQLTVNWTAPGGGVDNGGYIVVRGTADPTTAPNVNGIYAVNNTVAAGQSVVYVGTNTSFTDTGLTNGTTYYYRIYTFDKAYNYSSAVTVSGTPILPVSIPTVTTPTAASIATTSVTLGANVTSNGGATLTSRGTVWGTSASPTGNSLAEGGTTTGVFTHSRTGLTANTAYFYRGYAVNSAGTGYSADGTFTTLPLPPTVGTGSGATISGFTANWTHPTMGSANYTYTVEVDNDSNFGSIDATFSGISSSSTSQAITGLNAETTYYFRVRSVNATGSSENSSASAGIATLAASTPTLNAVTLSSALSSTYGAASNGVSFTASGSNLSGTITATAQSGYEVSSDDLTYSSSVSIASGSTVYVRFAATLAAGTYNGATAVVLSSTGATDANVTTSASGNTVDKKGLSIIGISIADKEYDRSTTATISGTAAYSGLVNGDSLPVAGTPTAAFSDRNVATGKSVTVSGYTAPSANYTITQPTGLTASITARALTLTGPAVTTKTYDGNTSATITGSLTGIISGDTVTLTGTGTFASRNVGTGISVTSTSTLAGANAGNYSLTQPTGLTGAINAKALTITGASATNRDYDGTTAVGVSGGSLSGVISSDSVTLGGSPAGTVASAAVGNTKTVTVTGYSISGTDSGNYSLTQPTGLTVNIANATPPTLTASANATVDSTFVVTFSDNALWRSNITSITVGGSTLAAAAYSIAAGQITFDPSKSPLLQSSGSKTIAVVASNYSPNVSVSQTVGIGAANKLAVTTQPTAPASNGAVLATQPSVTVQDQYGNAVTGSSASVTAAVGSGVWTLGGTTTTTAASGVATFSGLTATSAAAVTGATITFSSTGLTGATSSTFNIPTPPPANDLSPDATTITVNGGAVSGTLVGATYTAVAGVITDSKADVWFKFQAPAGGGTVTITTGSYNASSDLDLFVWDSAGSAWSGTTPTSTADFSATGTATSSESASGTIIAGRTYYIRVRAWSGNPTFTITATMPPVPSTQATSFTSSNITSSSATVGWTRGNGTGGVLVIARAGSAVNTDPTNETIYTANATFGSGTQIGTGNFVVYKGTGTSVNVTGLSAGTTYYFEIYEYNTTGLMHNLAGLLGNLTTSVGVPTVTSSAATGVSSTTATLNANLTADGGDAITGRGFVYSATDTTPTIGEAGVTQVSLSGTTGAMSTALSSLGANTTYYFNAYAINSFGTSYGTVQSFTTSQLSAPTTLAASEITSTGFTANWNAVTGATGYRLDVYTGSSNTVSLYSANFNAFTGSGFTPSPSAGQLDSDDWKVTGMSDGSSSFGGSFTTGDFAVGASTGGVTTGGIYAFTVGAGNVALGVQPTGNDWAPGTIVLRIQNTTGSTITSLDVSYKIWVLNDQGRSSSFNFSHSANDSSYTGVTDLDYTSTAAADATPAWVSVNRTTTITGLNIANNAFYYLRWSGADVGGSGSRDEFALDDVQISRTKSNIDYLAGYQDLSVGNVTNYAVTGAGATTQYSYVVRATSANSTSANSDVRLVTTKGVSTIFVTGTTSFTYNGTAQGPASSTVAGSTGARTYSYAGTGGTTYGPSSTAPINAGSYSVTATVAADANFDGATSAATAFTINKATPSIIAAPTASGINAGQSLASSALSGGSASVAGSFAWNDSTIVPAIGTSSQSVTFTPTDSANYNTAGTSVNVTVVSNSAYQTGYSSWTNSNSLTGVNALPDADPDGDGFFNSTEYAFGTRPNVADGSLVTTVATNGVFRTSWNGPASGVTYGVQSSANLSTMAFTNDPTITIESGGGVMSFTNQTTGNKFFRVRATSN